MNRFFDYDTPGAAEIYDKTRYAMGADVIAGLMHTISRNVRSVFFLITVEKGRFVGCKQVNSVYLSWYFRKSTSWMQTVVRGISPKFCSV